LPSLWLGSIWIPATGLLLMDYQPINYQPNDNLWQTLKLFDRVDGTGIKSVTYPHELLVTEKGWTRNGRIYNLS